MLLKGDEGVQNLERGGWPKMAICRMKQAAFKTEQYTKLRPANAGSVLEHRPKNRRSNMRDVRSSGPHWLIGRLPIS
jgi:hypothetical protein